MAKEKVFVQRKLVTKEDKEFYSYFIDVVVRGKENRVLISAPDIGGYKVLDIVFGNEDKAELTVQTRLFVGIQRVQTVTLLSLAIKIVLVQ